MKHTGAPGVALEDDVIREMVDLNITGDMTGAQGGHAGGDSRLVEDFLNVLGGKEPSLSTTSIEESISGHLIGFGSNRSVEEGNVVDINMSRWMKGN